MKGIGGNVTATIQIYTSAKNEIGESEKEWTDAQKLKGWLDLSAGDSDRTNFSTKLQESTHIFLCTYQPLPNVTAENSRMVINGIHYDVMLIDNVMELNEHYEIHLKRVGG